MSKENVNKGREKSINKDYFRGNVKMIEILHNENSSQYEMYHVFFLNNAITTIHYHETEQILIGTKGKGIVCTLKENFVENISKPEKVFIIEEGDVVSIPANVFHFHGSFSEKEFSHLAFRSRRMLNSEGKIVEAKNLWEVDFLEKTFGPDKTRVKEITRQIDNDIANLIKNLKEKYVFEM